MSANLPSSVLNSQDHFVVAITISLSPLITPIYSYGMLSVLNFRDESLPDQSSTAKANEGPNLQATPAAPMCSLTTLQKYDVPALRSCAISEPTPDNVRAERQPVERETQSELHQRRPSVVEAKIGTSSIETRSSEIQSSEFGVQSE